MAKRMQRRVYTDEAGRQREDKHVVLKRKVLLEDWQRITNALANLEFGVSVKTLPRKERLAFYNVKHRSIFSERVDSQLRVYPSGNLGAHVLVLLACEIGSAKVPMEGLEGKHGVR